jgi:ATP-dependent DNA helicase RecG
MQYTDQELELLLSDLESFLVERKERWAGDAPTKGCEAICAFANDLPGSKRAGVLFVGVRDDGTPTGLPITDELLVTLANLKSDGNTVPPPTLTVEKRKLAGADVAVVTVLPADSPPVRYRGRIWVRSGPRRSLATAQDERILNERRGHGDRPFDIRKMRDAALSDLDVRRFEDEYLPRAFAPDVLEANERTYLQRLAATKMIVSIEDPTPTAVGLLTLSSHVRDFIPGAYVQFLRVSGRELGDPISDELAVSGVLLEMIRRVEDKLISHNRTRVDFTSAAVEQRTQLYPLVALQQLVRNAVMHRTYEGTSSPIRVHWFDDRIEITNPGGPFGAVTAETFGAPGITDYRNPNLAEAMRVLGLVQRFGVGISTARRALRENGNPPLEFQILPNYVVATIRSAGEALHA